MTARVTDIRRTTNETDIQLSFSLDGRGNTELQTGIGFFDHMLNSFARHGLFDLALNCNGDLLVDAHHTVEDTGLVLGQAILEALGDKKGVRRYGSVILPMDDALVLCAIDLGGRPYFSYEADLTISRIGSMETELVEEFFRSVAYTGKMNLHIKQLSGKNNHHIIEAMFKAFGRALDEASRIDDRIKDVLSTKGSL